MILVAACAAAASQVPKSHLRSAPEASRAIYARHHLGGAAVAAAAKGDRDASEMALYGNRGEVDRTYGTPEEEDYANRAYPAADVPFASAQVASATFSNLSHRSHHGEDHQWKLLGPQSIAIQPGILSFSGADFVASGRVTAMAIAPTCTNGKCRLWVAAAGGGVWRTDHALQNNPDWKSVSDGLGTNATGALLVDPNDSSGNTLYLGTGEGNASGDSEAGVGIYKTTDGGNSWSLLPGSGQFYGRSINSMAVDPTNRNIIYAGIARGIRGESSVTGGTTSNPPVAAALGLWQSTDGGATFSLLWNGNLSLRGITHVALDPADPATVYASSYQQGIWRLSVRLDGDSSFHQVFAPGSPAQNVDRAEFALVTKTGHTRIYAGDGAVGAAGGKYSAVWRADNADIPASALLASQTVPAPGGWKQLTETSTALPGFATFDYCSGQCWYDNMVAVAPGRPDEVYVIGSFTYGELGGRSNARAVVRSTTAGDPDPANNNRTFTDMTFDSNLPAGAIHPDQHAIVFDPNNPNIIFEGSDGGVIRTSGTFTDISAQCDTRGLTPNSLLACHRMLSSVPTQIINMNKGLPTLQFQSVSVNPQSPAHELVGGTQDNGTWHFLHDKHTWQQTIYGDGGQAGIDVATPTVFFNTFTGQATDTNFQQGLQTAWTVTSGPLFASGEAASFYPPHIADPKVGGTQFVGLRHVFRTQDNGGSKTYLEANCPEFITFANDPACGDWVALGGPAGPNQPGDLTAAALGTRAGGVVAATERTIADNSTLWAATTTGRVFVSKNADANPSTSVTFTRIDTLSPAAPQRFVSSIYVDPVHPNHAWVSYSGYNFNTPTAPGHVFEVTYDPVGGTATWVNLDPANGMPGGGDLPVTDFLRDDATGDLYASTDFGVARLPNGSTTWEVAGRNLPPVEVAGLTISAAKRKLYAATHGRSVWVLALQGGDDNEDDN
ncbi:MAG TPA: exo-alpha-sialidase [Thermoanaerobaculia bacterium]|nr:exo-alpha-sialidase [Thermoanaerobaculia bacterium]